MTLKTITVHTKQLNYMPDPRSLNSTYKNPNKQNRESAVRIAQGACTVHESSATFDKNPSDRSKSSES